MIFRNETIFDFGFYTFVSNLPIIYARYNEFEIIDKEVIYQKRRIGNIRKVLIKDCLSKFGDCSEIINTLKGLDVRIERDLKYL